MNAVQAAYVMLSVAVVLSNLAVLFTASPRSNLLAWTGSYAIWMAIGRLLASSGGQAAPLPWEIWPTSLAFFAVISFPTIVWRYFTSR